MDVKEYDAIAGQIESIVSIQDAKEYHGVTSKLVQEFGQFAKTGVFTTRDTARNEAIATWLSEQLDEFWRGNLSQVSRTDNSQAAITAFAVAMKLLLISGKYRRKSLRGPIEELLRASLSSKETSGEWAPFLSKYDDIRLWFLTAVPEVVSDLSVRKLIPLMCEIEKTVEDDEDLYKFYAGNVPPKSSAKKYRTAFQKAWLAVLRSNGLTQSDVKQVLSVLHARIVPGMLKPQLLMDFLVDAYDYGGAVSLLALNGLFVLIQYHGLDYPHFFTKLYALLEDGSILVSSHRARFLRLLDLFLTSTHLPATIPASIIKRLARLCLFAPPGAIVAVIPFVYNQLKRHPTCLVMIHRASEVEKPDAFDPTESDPLHTHALESSLWELHALTSHYQPNVAAMAKVFEQPMRKPAYQLEHFLAHSYETMYATEKARRRDGIPALEHEEPNVFSEIPWAF